MKRLFLKYLILVFTIFVLGIEINAQNIAKNGLIDLSEFNFNENKTTKLDGEWQVVYGKFLSSKEFKNIASTEIKTAQIPNLWNNLEKTNPISSGKGIATYRLRIKINKDNISTLSLRFIRVYTSYKVWVNNSLVANSGKIGKSYNKEIPARITQEVHFPVKEKELEIIIQVSNFYHRKGGIENGILIGSSSSINRKSQEKTAFDIFLIGALTIMVFFHIGLFFLMQKDYSLIHISVLFFAVIMHTVTGDNTLLSRIIGSVPWELVLKIDYLSNHLLVLFFVLFFNSVSQGALNKIFLKIIIGFSVIMIGIILFTNATFYTETIILFEIAALISALYILVIQVVLLFKNKKDAFVMILGTLSILIAAVHDILLEIVSINSMTLLPVGVFAFLFFQTYILSSKFNSTYMKSKNLNKQTLKLEYLKNEFINNSNFDLYKPLEIISRNYNSSRAFIFQINKDNSIEIKSHFPKENTINVIPKNLLIKTLKQKELIIISNTLSKKCTEFDSEYLKQSKVKSALCVPFMSAKNTGIYLENNIEKDSFTQNNAKTLELISDQIIGIISNAEIYNELKHLNENLENIVKKRTSELSQKKDELLTQRDEIEMQNLFLKEIFEEISIQNKSINKNVEYAKKIQKATFPNSKYIDNLFAENFIYFKPKDELSGDFYWANKFTKPENIYIFAAVDCTGHGVSGAMMSLIGNNLLEQATIDNKLRKPSDILDNMQENITEKLQQETDDSNSKDGMDLALISYNTETKILEFSGARNPLYLVRNNEIIEYKADKTSIGGRKHARVSINKKFTNHTFKVQENDVIYLFSDGFIDQYGGDKNRKFMKKRFKELLLLLNQQKLSMSEQKEILSGVMQSWMKNQIQVDDMLVCGIRF